MHIPVDRYIIEAAKEPREKELIEGMGVFGLNIPYNCKQSWSRCDEYKVYKSFREAVMNETSNNQLEWEEMAWIAMATRHASEA